MRIRAIALATGLVMAGAAGAQEVPVPSTAPVAAGVQRVRSRASGSPRRSATDLPDQGDPQWHFVRIGGSEFVPDPAGAPYYRTTWNPPSNLNWLSYFTAPNMPHTYAWVHIPGGTLLNYVELDYCDPNPTYHLTLNVYDCDYLGNCGTGPLATVASTGNGCSSANTNVSNYTMDNYDREILLDVNFDAFNGQNELAGAIIGWQYQVHPAPASPTFGDVPTSSPQFQFVEALVAAGVTVGCGGSNYCPNSPVTRGQMAVFLSKALGLFWGGY